MSSQHGWKRGVSVVAVFVGVWLVLRFLFPLFLPFLLGLAIALTAEPLVKILQQKLHWRRSPAAFSAVTTALGALVGVLGLTVTLLVQRTASLARSFGAAAEQVTVGVETLRSWLERRETAFAIPSGLAQPLSQSVNDLFQDGGGLLHRGAEAAFNLAGHAAQHMPGALVTLGTAVLAAYMISVQLPALTSRVTALPAWQNRWKPALVRLKGAAGSWLKAQFKLSGVTFCIVLGGFFLLGVKNKVALAVFTALVDAVPLLGSGTVLLPWALVSVLGGEPVRAVGLLGVYVTALIIRSSLEPKLVGRQLGLNPLAALMALYAGYRFWGFGGMILAPILTVTARELCRGD